MLYDCTYFLNVLIYIYIYIYLRFPVSKIWEGHVSYRFPFRKLVPVFPFRATQLLTVCRLETPVLSLLVSHPDSWLLKVNFLSRNSISLQALRYHCISSAWPSVNLSGCCFALSALYSSTQENSPPDTILAPHDKRSFQIYFPETAVLQKFDLLISTRCLFQMPIKPPLIILLLRTNDPNQILINGSDHLGLILIFFQKFDPQLD